MLRLILFLLVCAGLERSAAYLIRLTVSAVRFRLRHRNVRANLVPFAGHRPVTLLKPMRGMGQRRRENLESFFLQEYPSRPNAEFHNLQKMVQAASHKLLVMSARDLRVFSEYVRVATAPFDPRIGVGTLNRSDRICLMGSDLR
jgi:hypothetical protein